MCYGETEYIKANIEDATLAQIAGVIRDDWNKPSQSRQFADPYINAMGTMHTKQDTGYGFDMPNEQVTRFLGNANGWRGETARIVKAELKRRIK